MLSAIIYIHGFNSSPQSVKAQQFKAHFECSELPGQGVNLSIPALDYQPAVAMAQLVALVEAQQGEPVLLVGSSLGGYYSLYLAERFANCRAVLINPAVYPYRLLHDLLGENQNMYTGQRYQLTALHIAQLKALDVERPSDPERLLLLTQTGDETLDYREAVSKLDAITQCVTQGGDHSYQGFEQKIEQIISFGLGSR